MMEPRPRLVLALAALVAVWLAGFIMTRPSAPSDPETAWLERLTRSEAFQTRMRDGIPAGCLALPYQDPEIIVFGSSHADADIDAALISKELGQRVGVCGLSAFNPDMLPTLLEMIDREGLRPDRLIWMVDGGSFHLLPLAEQRLAFAESALGGEMGERVDAWLERWPSDGSIDRTELARQARAYRDDVVFHAAELDKLDPDVVEARVRSRADDFYLALDNLIPDAKPHPRADERIADFCADLNARGIELVALVSPLPDLSTSRHPDFAAVDAGNLETRLSCATRIIARPTSTWGVDIRHYLNRKSDPEYDYTLWSAVRPERDFHDHVDGLSRRLRLSIYDTDHLNAVGSEIFSRELASELRSSRGD